MCNRLFQFKDDIAKNKDIQKPAIAYNTNDTLQQAIAVWFVDVTRYSSAIAHAERPHELGDFNRLGDFEAKVSRLYPWTVR